jgi:putative transposase
MVPYIMVRLARAVAPGAPHHITQRGNRRQQTFFCDGDYEEYLTLMSRWCQKRGVEIWAYCLMPNHVHLIAVPETEDALRLAIGEAHRRYTRMINFREGWRGHLWQGRFASFIMDDIYLMTCARYVELNPVRAGLAERPEDWPWSSARAHLTSKDDALCKVKPLLDRCIGPWHEFLAALITDDQAQTLRLHERTGRPLGSETFIANLEQKLERNLQPKNPGRPRKRKD